MAVLAWGTGYTRASDRAVPWLLMCLEDQRYAEKEDAQSQEIEEMAPHSPFYPMAGRASRITSAGPQD